MKQSQGILLGFPGGGRAGKDSIGGEKMNLRVWGDPAGDKEGQSQGGRERRMDLGVGKAPKSMDSAFFLLLSHQGVRKAHPPCFRDSWGQSLRGAGGLGGLPRAVGTAALAPWGQ